MFPEGMIASIPQRTKADPVPALESSTIAHVIEANLNAYLLSYGSLPGAVRHDAADVAWVDSGLPTAIYNSVVAARFDPASADRQIEAVLDHFRRVARPVTWHVGPTSMPRALDDLLLAHGFEHSEDEPGMAVALDQSGPVGQEPATPAGLTIDPVRDEGDLADWVDIWLFPLPQDARRLFRDALRHRALRLDVPWHYYVGWLDGRPVATAELFTDGTVASVHYVVTLPAARRRGIGAAITRHTLAEARARGCRIAVLTASPDGFGIYHRLGFREHCRIRRYEWEPSQDGATEHD